MFQSSKKWLFFIMPSSIAAEGLHIAMPLYVLFLGGNVADVGIVIGLHYAFSSLGSIFWGKIIDKYHVKRIILLVSFSVITACCIWLFFITELSAVFLISPIAGFFIIGKNPVTQLLVMESVPNNQWSKLFANISILTGFGSLIAFVVGSIWDSFFDLKPYFLFCALTSAGAVLFSILVGSKSFLERETLVHSVYGLKHVFNHNRYNFQLIFTKIPKKYDFRHLTSLFQRKMSHEIGILYFTNFLFYFGSNIYFTAFIPFLKEYSFTDSQVFIIYLIQTITLLAIFFVVPKLIAKVSEEKAAQIAYLPRILGIIIASALIPIASGFDSFIVAAVSSSLMVSAFSIFSTASSVILFKTIPRGFEGRFLGVNSFMVGLGIFLGAITSGFVANSINYPVAFTIASVGIFFSLLTFRSYLKHRLSHKVV
ncbi:MAG: MFS transporter [Crenarchaeota archaeon]|nr:MAG: MFS transporter [Thermoproteota archaeon]RDJ32857.1 MAG: MFS transporter [Thermoproteota archaeon]RDJ38026.1 MAG: MFS transporter [Thermoproteota archaeon]RDJ38310.1 MAG: MFS transporter [Thermoproteota archaeon]